MILPAKNYDMAKKLGDHLGGKRVLVVDDDAVCLRSISRVLEGYGAQVQAIQDGREAIEVLRERNVDLLVLDIVMPDMDGWEVYAIIREELGWKELPILFYTGLVDDMQANFLNEGPSENGRILAKGGPLSELLNEIVELLDSKSSQG